MELKKISKILFGISKSISNTLNKTDKEKKIKKWPAKKLIPNIVKKMANIFTHTHKKRKLTPNGVNIILN